YLGGGVSLTLLSVAPRTFTASSPSSVSRLNPRSLLSSSFGSCGLFVVSIVIPTPLFKKTRPWDATRLTVVEKTRRGATRHAPKIQADCSGRVNRRGERAASRVA